MSLEDQVKTLESLVSKLQARVQELEDVREIGEVQRRWNRMVTGGFNGLQALRTGEASELLTEDATLEYAPMHDKGDGPKGHEELRKYWEPFQGAGGVHYVFQSGSDYSTEVHGDTAFQKSNVFLIAQGASTEHEAELGALRFRNEFRRTPQGWKISRIRHMRAVDVPLHETVRASELRPDSGWTPEDCL